VIESGESPSLISELVGIRYTHVFSPNNIFNKSWLINIGLRQVGTKDVFITDIKYNQSITILDSIYEKVCNDTSVNVVACYKNEDSKIDAPMYYKTSYIKNIGGYDETIMGDYIYPYQEYKMSFNTNIGMNELSNIQYNRFIDESIPFVSYPSMVDDRRYENLRALDKAKTLQYLQTITRKFADKYKYKNDSLWIQK